MVKIGLNEQTRMKYLYVPRSVERVLGLNKGDEVEFVLVEVKELPKPCYVIRKKISQVG